MQHVITVTPPAAPTVTLPAGLPATLDCASADSYATPADATYTNSESGTCEISGTLSPTVTNSFDACSGGTITIDYAGTDACGNALSAACNYSNPASSSNGYFTSGLTSDFGLCKC